MNRLFESRADELTIECIFDFKEPNKVKYIPNILSAYRLLALPVLFLAIFTDEYSLYVWLLCINLVTDILDGFLARRFGWETEFGARLDSTADIGTYLAAFTGIYVLEPAFFNAYRIELVSIILFFAAPQVVSFIRFGRNSSLHLYSNKTAGYLQGIFFFTYFTIGFYAPYFYFMLIFSYLAWTEALIILLFIPQLRSNVKGLYWMWKTYGAIR